MNCGDCGSVLGKDAIKCRCGWKVGKAVFAAAVIPCAYSDCSTPALARIHQKTGWASVCPYHYGVTNFTRPIANSPVVREVLEAYGKSKAYAEKHNLPHESEPGADEEELAA